MGYPFRLLPLLFMAAMIVATSDSAVAQEAFHPERFTDLGIPVRRNALYNHVLGKNADGHERYYQAYRGVPWFLVSINPCTGESEEFIAKGHNGNPWGMLWASTGKLYVSTGGGGTDDVFVFDPATRRLEYLGRPTATEIVVWTLCEAENGKLYGGTYPNAKLVSIDLKTHELTDLGSICEDQKYIRSLDTQGRFVYCNVGPSKAGVWAYHMDTGEKMQILPETFRSELTWGNAQKRADGNIYVQGKSNTFRVNGLALEPVERMPPARVENHQGDPTRFPLTTEDGARIRVTTQSGPEKYFFVKLPDGTETTVSIDYTGTPIALWGVMEGPDGLIYGTTRSPITLFVYDPKNGSTRVLGDPIGAHGQVYGWTWHKGKLFMAAYGKSRVTVWDPARAWNFGATPDSNPRLIGSCQIDRPSSLVLAPDGKHLLAGGAPHYGKVGGVLTVIDPESSRIEAIPDLFGEQSIASMVSVPETDFVCIGTTWRGGSASEAKPSAPRLILWDFSSRKVVYETAAAAGEDAIVQMVSVGRRIYCVTSDEGRLIVFDPYARQVLNDAPLGFGKGSLFGLRYRQADHRLYAISGTSVVRIHPETLEIERLGAQPDLNYGMALASDSIYFCSGERLLRFDLPPVGTTP